jgi:hypothetical protein
MAAWSEIGSRPNSVPSLTTKFSSYRGGTENVGKKSEIGSPKSAHLHDEVRCYDEPSSFHAAV